MNEKEIIPMLELLQGFPGEAILWPLMLLIMVIWGRKKERDKSKR